MITGGGGNELSRRGLEASRVLGTLRMFSLLRSRACFSRQSANELRRQPTAGRAVPPHARPSCQFHLVAHLRSRQVPGRRFLGHSPRGTAEEILSDLDHVPPVVCRFIPRGYRGGDNNQRGFRAFLEEAYYKVFDPLKNPSLMISWPRLLFEFLLPILVGLYAIIFLILYRAP